MIKKFLLGQYSLVVTFWYVHFSFYVLSILFFVIFPPLNYPNKQFFFFCIYLFLIILFFTMIGVLNSSINYIKEKKRNKQRAENGYLSIIWILFLLIMGIKGMIFR